jgi:hypothetical protein
VAKKKCDKNCPYRLLKIRCPFGVKETKKKVGSGDCTKEVKRVLQRQFIAGLGISTAY